MQKIIKATMPYLVGAFLAAILSGGIVIVGKAHYYLRVVWKMEEILKNSKVPF